MFCDFRLRPPVGDFLGTAQYNLERNARIAASFGMYQAESTARLSMDLFLAEMDAVTAKFSAMFPAHHCGPSWPRIQAGLPHLPE